MRILSAWRASESAGSRPRCRRGAPRTLVAELDRIAESEAKRGAGKRALYSEVSAGAGARGRIGKINRRTLPQIEASTSRAAHLKLSDAAREGGGGAGGGGGGGSPWGGGGGGRGGGGGGGVGGGGGGGGGGVRGTKFRSIARGTQPKNNKISLFLTLPQSLYPHPFYSPSPPPYLSLLSTSLSFLFLPHSLSLWFRSLPYPLPPSPTNKHQTHHHPPFLNELPSPIGARVATRILGVGDQTV